MWKSLRKKEGIFILLFVLAYVVILGIKFWDLLSINQILPGGDTIGHFFAFQEYIESLSRGDFFAYITSWFGGQPLFQFYPPLLFLIMAGIYGLFGKIIGLFFVFRWVIFLSFALFPLSFYVFLKEFFNKKTARWGLWVSILWVLYPKLISFIGVGAAGAVFYGLISQVFAVHLFLWFLVLLKRIINQNKFSFKLLVGAILVVAGIVLSHTLTTIAAVVATILFLLYYWRALVVKMRIGMLAAVVLGAVLLSAFWLVPFIDQLRFTSASRVDFNAYLGSPLIPFLHFDIQQLFDGHITTFDFVWLCALALFIVGVISLFKKRNYIIPFFLTSFFLLFNLSFLSSVIIPTTPLHYYRFVAYEVVWYLAIVAYGLACLVSRLDSQKVIRGIIVGICAASLVHMVVLYNLGDGMHEANKKPRLAGVDRDLSYYWSNWDFPLFKEGQGVVDMLRDTENLPEPPRRVVSGLDTIFLVDNLGSIHFFNTFVPLINNQASLVGLYAESAYQVPFIFPAANTIIGGSFKWGRVQDLFFSEYFLSQDTDTMIDRLRMFGVNYLILNQDYFDAYLDRLPGVEKVGAAGPFHVYWVKDSDPLVHTPQHVPGVFIEAGGDIDFRAFAIGWYAVPELLDYPTIRWQKNIAHTTPEELEEFPYVVVSAESLDEAAWNHLASFEKPLFIVSGTQGNIVVPNSMKGDVVVVNDYRPVGAFYNGSTFQKDPDVEDLQKLKKFIHTHAVSYTPEEPALGIEITDDRIIIDAQGPAIVNMSYFPYWHSDQATVYEVTPGQMLVFSDGLTTLTYGPDTTAKVSVGISIVTTLSLIVWGVIRKKKCMTETKS